MLAREVCRAVMLARVMSPSRTRSRTYDEVFAAQETLAPTTPGAGILPTVPEASAPVQISELVESVTAAPIEVPA